MKKSIFASLLIVSLIFFPMVASADMGNVFAKSKDIDIAMFGSMRVLPHMMENLDFNDDDTNLDWLLDEAGVMENHNVRGEFRVGWSAKADNWDFLVILESDFVLNKPNGDRGDDGDFIDDGGMSGEDFGVEKLNFGYDFGSFKINVGWNTKFLDIRTGGILYGDDHPYIGFSGKFGNNPWEMLYLMIYDETIGTPGGTPFDGDSADWRAYTFRIGFDLGGYTLAPMYAFSDNEAHGADAHYLGVEGYGKIGMFTPRFEFVYAIGEQDDDIQGDTNDINAYGFFASLEAHISKAFNVYFGGYYLSGDDDPTDDDVEAFIGIGNVGRYTPTFGMESAIIYRWMPSLGSFIYANDFSMIGSTAGYGGGSNTGKSDSPGMIMLGIGARGALSEQLSYKAQAMYFAFAEEDSIVNKVNPGQEVDDEIGVEVDLLLSYQFDKHFSIDNTIGAFFPGDGTTDRLGEDYDTTCIVDTIEIKWKF